MLNRRRPLTPAACAVLVALLAAAAGLRLELASPTARAASIGQLQKKISSGQGNVSALSGAVKASSGRIGQLNASIAALARRLSRIQADLIAKRAELAKLRAELKAARIRLAQLEAFEAHAEGVLAQQLVATYESDNPDVVTVVMSATGFRDLLERLAFMERVRKQDVNIIGQVRAARRAVAAEATRLGRLEVRQQRLTAQVLAERNTLGRTQASLWRQRAAVARFRAVKAGERAKAQAEVDHLQQQLSQLKAAQAALAASARRSSGSSGAGRRWRRWRRWRRRHQPGDRELAPARYPAPASPSRCPRAPPPRPAPGRPIRASTSPRPATRPSTRCARARSSYTASAASARGRRYFTATAPSTATATSTTATLARQINSRSAPTSALGRS